jgi:hypothetical protein
MFIVTEEAAAAIRTACSPASRQRQGEGVRPVHRWLEASADDQGDAAAS